MIRVSRQEWKKIYFCFVLFLLKSIYAIVQANNIYLQKIDTMSFYLIVIRPLAQFCIESMSEQNVKVINGISRNTVF